MKTICNRLLLIFGMLIILPTCTTNYITPFVELSDPNHEEIASIRKTPWDSYVVIYNPTTCDLIGEACGFFRAHAYAHYRLDHSLIRPKYYPPLSEMQADCYVAKYGRQNEIQAAVKLLMDENRDSSLKIHGDPMIRAENIIDCAKQAGNWSDSK